MTLKELLNVTKSCVLVSTEKEENVLCDNCGWGDISKYENREVVNLEAFRNAGMYKYGILAIVKEETK